MPVTIRPAEPADLEAIIALGREWGYELAPENVRRHSQTDEHRAFAIADVGGEAAGWIEVVLEDEITGPPRGHITALVVGEKFRRQGVGQQLVDFAKQWAAQKGAKTIRVRTRVDRKEAPDFYRAIGFEEAKRQIVFEAKLS
ncbi:MAG: GNAT family N-acetyltransferase [Armatimonadetes bacterium]|nr:GNAT family N-acetyltransferase [Armatimonadota bacterium]